VLFRRLAVFAGGCTLEGAEAVCPAGGGLDIDVFEGLASLTDKSLVREADTGVEREPRYTMLHTIRDFGLEQLAASGEVDTLRRAHADYFLDLAQRAEPYLTGAQQGVGWSGSIENTATCGWRSPGRARAARARWGCG